MKVFNEGGPNWQAAGRKLLQIPIYILLMFLILKLYGWWVSPTDGQNRWTSEFEIVGTFEEENSLGYVERVYTVACDECAKESSLNFAKSTSIKWTQGGMTYVFFYPRPGAESWRPVPDLEHAYDFNRATQIAIAEDHFKHYFVLGTDRTTGKKLIREEYR